MYLTAASYAGLFAVERAIGGAITDATVAKAAFEPVLHLIPRAWSACAGVATIVVLFAAARELFSRRVALLGAALLAVAFLHVRDSHFGVTDVPVTFLTMCAFWAGLRCATRGLTLERVAMAGVLSGLAASTKYNSALVLLPVVVAILSRTVWNQPRSMGVAVRAVAVLLLCATIAFLAGTPFAVLDHRTFITAVTGVRHHLANGHVVMARGWTYHATFTLQYGLGIPLVVAAVLGACWLIARQPWAAALVLAFPLPYYVVLGSGLTVFVRYMLPIVPFLCLTAAVFVDRLAGYIGDAFKSARLRDVSTVVLAAVIAVPTVVPSVIFDRLMTSGYARHRRPVDRVPFSVRGVDVPEWLRIRPRAAAAKGPVHSVHVQRAGEPFRAGRPADRSARSPGPARIAAQHLQPHSPSNRCDGQQRLCPGHYIRWHRRVSCARRRLRSGRYVLRAVRGDRERQPPWAECRHF